MPPPRHRSGRSCRDVAGCDGSALLTSITLGPRARRCRDSPAPHEPVASTPIAPTSPKLVTQPVRSRSPRAVATNDAVSPSRPTSSPTTATWTSLWVSTPATTRRSSPSAMVDTPPLLLTWMGWHARPGRWTRQGAGLIAQAPLRSRSPDRSCLGQRPTHSADRSDHRHQSDLADLRVRPSERNPARFLDDRRNGHADHPCRSRPRRSVSGIGQVGAARRGQSGAPAESAGVSSVTLDSHAIARTSRPAVPARLHVPRGVCSVTPGWHELRGPDAQNARQKQVEKPLALAGLGVPRGPSGRVPPGEPGSAGAARRSRRRRPEGALAGGEVGQGG